MDTAREQLGDAWLMFLLLLGLVTIRPCHADVQILSRDQSLEWGASLRLRCISLHGYDIQWFHNGRPVYDRESLDGQTVEPDSRYSLRDVPQSLHNLRASDLEIADLQYADSGNISCAENDNGRFLHHSDVTIHVINNNRIGTVEIIEPNVAVLLQEPRSDLTIKCRGAQGDRLQWLHNSTVLQRGRDVVITTALTVSGHEISLMSKLSLKPRDAGLYECRSEDNPQNSDRVEIHVSVAIEERANVEMIIPVTDTLTLARGARILITCRADVGTVIVWYHGNIRLYDQQDGYVFIRSANSDTFTLVNENTDVQGEFRCQNEANPMDSDSVLIRRIASATSTGPSTLPVNYKHVPLTLNSVLELSCSIETAATDINFTVTWYHKSSVLQPDERVTIKPGQRSSLTVRSTGLEDVGLYVCAFNDTISGQGVAALYFQVTATPCPELSPSAYFTPINCSGIHYVGDTCRIRCMVDGIQQYGVHPITCRRHHGDSSHGYWPTSDTICELRQNNPAYHQGELPSSLSHLVMRIGSPVRLQCGHPTVSWKLDDQDLYNSEKFNIVNGTLAVLNPDKTDAGIYTCILKEPSGFVFGYKKYNVTVLECEPLPVPKYATISGCSSPPLFGETCRFTCQSPHRLVGGSELRTCELEPVLEVPFYTGNPPVCQDPNATPGSEVSDAHSSAFPIQPALSAFSAALLIAFSAALFPS